MNTTEFKANTSASIATRAINQRRRYGNEEKRQQHVDAHGQEVGVDEILEEEGGLTCAHTGNVCANEDESARAVTRAHLAA